MQSHGLLKKNQQQKKQCTPYYIHLFCHFVMLLFHHIKYYIYYKSKCVCVFINALFNFNFLKHQL